VANVGDSRGDQAGLVTSWTVVNQSNQTIANGSGSIFAFVPGDNGVYTVTLTKRDALNAPASMTFNLVAANFAPALGAFSLTRNGGSPINILSTDVLNLSEGDALVFSPVASDAAGDLPTLQYAWTVRNQNGDTIASNAVGVFGFVVPDNGSYLVTLT